jgi:integrase
MSRLAARYASSPSSPYLLNILREEKGDIRRQYHNALTVINRHLKEIGRKMKLPLSLTMYVARHSWASIAREKGIPLSVISEGMGHDSESTTQIYLASLEAGIVDKANRRILGLL